MKTVVTMAALVAASGTAMAGVTNVADFGGETNVSELLSLLFAGNQTTVAANNTALAGTGPDRSISGLTGVRRVDDFGAGITDRLFQDGVQEVSAEALFFGDTLFNGASNVNASPFDGTSHDLSTVAEFGATGSETENFASGTGAPSGDGLFGPITGGAPAGVFSWLVERVGASNQDDASTVESRNTGRGSTPQDRVITFELDLTTQIRSLADYALDANGDLVFNGSAQALADLFGPAADEVNVAYLHFADTGQDGDFQDFVWLSAGARAIPLPHPAALATAGLAGLGVVRRRRSA